jgi:predicted kinase|tara:strand:+ start:325 stop:846 length:522 start_codon:yes stop_codon:yes gene_type:complete
MKTKNKLIIIRGVACSGKTTIAEKLRKYFPKEKTAIIHTNMFYHGIVDGDKNNEVVIENARRIADNYLKNNYTVILEGTLSYKDKNGKLYLNKFISLGRKYKVKTIQLFFTTNFEELQIRETKRNRLSIKKLKKFYNRAINTKKNNEITIDTTNKSIEKVLIEVNKNIKNVQQ